MNKLPQAYKKHLGKDRLLWYEHKAVSKFIPIFNIVGIILPLGIILLLSDSDSGISMFIILISILIMFNNGYKLFDNLMNHHGGDCYIITNKRILYKKYNEVNFSEISLSKIYKIENEGTELNSIILTFYSFEYSNTVKDNLRTHANFESHYILKKDINRIITAWEKISPFSQFKKAMVEIKDKYDLKSNDTYSKNDQGIEILGAINGLKVLSEFRMDNLKPQFTISISCPNEFNNHLQISKEKQVDGIKKKFGMQDIIIGHYILDDKYIFQSNDNHFFSHIINKDIESLMEKSHSLLDGNIEFGPPNTSKKRSKNNTQNPEILDDKFIQDMSSKIKERKLGNRSVLTFHSKELYKFMNNPKEISSEIKLIFDIVIHISQNIQTYNENN